MTQKLYEQDAYIQTFEATALSCEPYGDKWTVVLDRTAFFPEGGGQSADTGRIADAAVVDTQIRDGIVTHVTTSPVQTGVSLPCRIDWDVRFERMQNHTGEHLVSGLIHAAFGYDNVGFHMGEDVITLDVNGTLTADDVRRIEEQANRAVYENKAVFATYPTPEEIVSIDYRSKLDLTEGVRLITIDGYDCCACCAPHVRTTGEIGVVKLLDAVPNKGGTRIEMICGITAYRDYVMLHDDNRKVMRLLSASRDKTAAFVERDRDVMTALKAENKRLSEQLALAQMQTETCGEVLCGFTKAASFDELRFCANEVSGDGITALFSDNGDGTMGYVVCSECADVRETVKMLNTAFQGKGGGKPNYAQGKLTATREQITEMLRIS